MSFRSPRTANKSGQNQGVPNVDKKRNYLGKREETGDENSLRKSKRAKKSPETILEETLKQ
jgi:hypothetical protein